MDWKNFKVNVSDYLNGDEKHTPKEYEDLYKSVCEECSKDGSYRIVERDGFFFVEKIPEQSLDELKARKQEELNAAHEKAESEAYVVSSLGFTVDADNRANRDIDGILKTIGDGTVMFCDYENEFHELNRAQCETLQVEIIQNAQSLYAQKWAYRTQVEAAESVEELELLEFTFSNLCF